MPSTVWFATNRVAADPTDPVNGYRAARAAGPSAMTFGAASVAGSAVDIIETAPGGFTDAMVADIVSPDRDLLLFLHGFDNTFSDALTCAANNAEWLFPSNGGVAATTVLAFSWPSLGALCRFDPLDPIASLLIGPYLADREMAAASAPDLAAFFDAIRPIFERERSRKAILLAHSMGNLALHWAVQRISNALSDVREVFSHAILAAADCPHDSFAVPNRGLSGLDRIARRIVVAYNRNDQVLHLSRIPNHAVRRMGDQGPDHMTDPSLFPLSTYRFLDCSHLIDYPYRRLLASHQYYRLSPGARSLIVQSAA